MFGLGALKPRTVVRKETREIVEPVSTPVNGARPAGAKAFNSSNAKTPSRGPPPNRFQLSQRTKPAPALKRRAPSSAQESRKKKKIQTPLQTFRSDDSDDSSEEERLERARRIKQERQRQVMLSVDEDRVFRDTANWSAGGAQEFEMIHSTDVTVGKYEKDFLPAFEDEFAEVKLQYPSHSQLERFRIVETRELKAYDPVGDINDTMRSVLEHYLPEEESKPYLDESSGLLRRLRLGVKAKDFAAYEAVVTEYNTIIRSALEAGTIATTMDQFRRLPAKLLERIMEQIYSRTVSPRINEVKHYKNGTDNVYGELNPIFCSQIFKDTGLKSKHVFLDLGSGVGNVVLQAALEIGCESWGIEQMVKPSELADIQAKEFAARTRLWGLQTGDVHLLRGDFFKHEGLHEVLRRADVVLVNNQAFRPETNTQHLDTILLELREGARLVSLRSFGPDFKLTKRTSESVVAVYDMVKKHFLEGWVSWTHSPGEYTVATKDSARIKRLLGAVWQNSPIGMGDLILRPDAHIGFTLGMAGAGAAGSAMLSILTRM